MGGKDISMNDEKDKSKVDDEKLDKISGGQGVNPEKPWEVIDDKNGQFIYDNSQECIKIDN